MIVGVILALGSAALGIIVGFQKAAELLCVGVVIAGVGLLLYNGFILP